MAEKQLDLFAPGKRAPVNNARETRAAAMVAIQSDAGRLRRKVLAMLIERGDTGATDAEIQAELKMEGNTERPRRRELVQAGVVCDSQRVRQTKSGRAAVVWVINPELTKTSEGNYGCQATEPSASA